MVGLPRPQFRGNHFYLDLNLKESMKKLNLSSSLILILTSISTLCSQQIIFPGLKGDSLLTELRRYYEPSVTLDYDQARTMLYSKVFLRNDTLECFYSGHKVAIPRGTPILSWTARMGFQTDHLYPRSYGAASGAPLSDLHHLVPALATINTLRKNSPFVDILDHKTRYWLLKDKVYQRPDPAIIDKYTESATGMIEPREIRKGDVARSLFYFYSIYGTQAARKNRTYFSSMLPDLCRWNRLDRPDSSEYNRTLSIGRIQGNVNPFVIDPSLADRCFCKNYPGTPSTQFKVTIYPNPSKGLFYIDIPGYAGPLVMKISDQSGKLLETHHLVYSGLLSWRLGEGVWKLEVVIDDSSQTDVLLVRP